MNSAIDTIAALEETHSNWQIDWEAILEEAYVALLEGTRPAVIDVGAHCGRHAVAIQHRLNPAQMLLFEPLPEQYAHLQRLFADNPNVDVRAVALGNHAAKDVRYTVKTTVPEESGLRQRSFYNNGRADDLKEISVPIARMDDLGVDFQIDYIKLDTEGGELDILKGARTTIQRDQPIISVEYGPGGYDAYGYTKDDLYLFATANDYSLFDLFGNRFGSLDEWQCCVSRFYWDYLMIHNTKIAMLQSRLAKLGRFAYSPILFPVLSPDREAAKLNSDREAAKSRQR